jgi:serine/threonine protein kinase
MPVIISSTLQVLLLSDNKITAVEKWMLVNVPELTHLNLKRNLINSVDFELIWAIMELTRVNLFKLELEGNPITFIKVVPISAHQQANLTTTTNFELSWLDLHLSKNNGPTNTTALFGNTWSLLDLTCHVELEMARSVGPTCCCGEYFHGIGDAACQKSASQTIVVGQTPEDSIPMWESCAAYVRDTQLSSLMLQRSANHWECIEAALPQEELVDNNVQMGSVLPNMNSSYTTSLWRYRCAIDSSPIEVDSDSSSNRNTHSSGASGGAGTVLYPVAALALGAIVVAAVFQIMRRKQSSSAAIASAFVVVAKTLAEARFVIEYRQLVCARSMTEFQRDFQQLEVARSAVRLGPELGRGQSGVVFLGSICGREIDVAIKTRIDDSVNVGSAVAVADEALLLEAMLLNGLRHSGIVTLLAVVTIQSPILVCTEFMENGNLRDFLRRCRPNQKVRTRINRVVGSMDITPTVMTTMAAKLSSAMAFIEEKGIIHRDIAARNVLVGNNATAVKIADLGAARNVHRTSELACNGVYIAKTDHSPARWMSLEALRDAQFSHKSDVFAFGVLLWEILSLGQTPWGVFGVPEFTQALENGERLVFPRALERTLETSIAKTIYSIALRCWKESPTKRPHLHQVEAEFAIHHGVLAATAHDVAFGTIISETAHPLAAGGETDDMLPTLDTDGYVADTPLSQQPNPCADRFAFDAGSNQQPILDGDGYVTDILLDETSGAAERSHFQGGGLSAISAHTNAALAQAQNAALVQPKVQSSIAIRARAPSVYDGFGNTTRPPCTPNVQGEPGVVDTPTIESSKPTSSLQSKVEVQSMRPPSLHLGFVQGSSNSATLHEDETRL